MKARVIPILSATYAMWFTIGSFAPYLPLYAFEVLGASNFIVGMLSTVYFGVSTPTSTIMGYIVDKFGKPRLIVSVSLMSLSVINVLPIFVNKPEYLLIVRILQGAAGASIIPITNLIASYELGAGRGVGYVGMIGALGFLTSTLLGGIVSGAYGYKLVFILASMVACLSAFINFISLVKIVDVKPGTAKFKLKYLREIPLVVWFIYICMFLRQAGGSGIWALFSLYLRSLGASDFVVGVSYTLSTLSQVSLMRYFAEKSESKGLSIFLLGLMLSAITFAGYYLSWNPYMVLPFQVIIGASWSALSMSANVYIVKNVRDEIKATALGMVSTSLGLSWIVGATANGIVSEIMKSYKAYMLLALTLTLIAIILFTWVKKSSQALPESTHESVA